MSGSASLTKRPANGSIRVEGPVRTDGVLDLDAVLLAQPEVVLAEGDAV